MIIVQGLVESAPSEEVLLTGSGDGSVKLWRLTHGNNGAPIPWFELENGDDAVLSLAIEGSLLYCGLAGGALNIWNLDSRQLVKQITEHQGDLWALDIMDGIAIAGDAKGVIKVRTIQAYLNCMGWLLICPEIQFELRRNWLLDSPRRHNFGLHH